MKSSGSKKLGEFKQHLEFIPHKQALRNYWNYHNKKSNRIKILTDKEKRNMRLEDERIIRQNTEVVKILLDVAKVLSRQGLAFRRNNDKDGNSVQIV